MTLNIKVVLLEESTQSLNPFMGRIIDIGRLKHHPRIICALFFLVSLDCVIG